MQRTLVFPRVQIDAVNRATEVYETASGKSINVARVAHTLGENVFATGFLGGSSGEFIRADIAACGFASQFVQVQPKTRTCITMIDQSSGATTELVEEAKPVDPADWDALRSVIANQLASAKVLVLSGSLPPGAPQDFYAWCCERANERRIQIILDASGEPLMRAISSKPTLVKPNRSELAKSLNLPLDSDAMLKSALRALIDHGPACALVTEGKSGALLSNGERFWRLHPPTVKAINPIGSGDSLAAGIAAGISRGLSMLEACKLGMACGAANAETLTAGVVVAARVNELVQQIGVESW